MTYVAQPADPAAAPKRPGAVTAIAVLAIAFGAMGLLCMPMNLIYIATGWRAAGPMGPAMWANHAFRTYTLVSLPISAALCVLYIVAGVGMLRLRSWARKLAIGLLLFAMLSQVVGTLVMAPQVGPMFDAALQAMPTPPTAPPGAMPDLSFMKPLMYGAIAMGALIGLAIMVVLLVILTRPSVRKAFEPGH